MSAQPLPAASPSVLAASLDDEAVVLDLASKRYFQLNTTGAAIWQGIADGESTEALVARLVDSFDVAPGDAVAAVTAFVAELRARGLVGDA
ncbi:MAG: PqqD family protein [Gemmatimonadaceae bacterium]